MTNIRLCISVVMASVAVTADHTAIAAQPVGSAFSYQGQLKKDGRPVTETNPGCDFTLRLFDDPTSGKLIGKELPRTLPVVDGLFTVNDLDFGADTFSGADRWLEIEVECPLDDGSTTLSPRQPITPSPYAIHTKGTVSAINVRDFGAKGDGVTNDTKAFELAISAALGARCTGVGGSCDLYDPDSCGPGIACATWGGHCADDRPCNPDEDYHCPGQCTPAGSRLFIPTGTYLVDTIRILATADARTKYLWIQGAGEGRTRLKSRTGADVIARAGADFDSYFITIESLSIEGAGPTGNSGHGIAFHPRLPNAAHENYAHSLTIRNVQIRNCGGSGVYLWDTFSQRLEGVVVDNCGDHLFNIHGGNSTLLSNCVAWRAADGKAGYRIRHGTPVLIACNGTSRADPAASVDWGVFGADSADPDDHGLCGETAELCFTDGECGVCRGSGEFCDPSDPDPCDPPAICDADQCVRGRCSDDQVACDPDDPDACGARPNVGCRSVRFGYSRPTLIGCNIEHFTHRGCYFKEGSRGSFFGCMFKGELGDGLGNPKALEYDYAGDGRTLGIIDATSHFVMQGVSGPPYPWAAGHAVHVNWGSAPFVSLNADPNFGVTEFYNQGVGQAVPLPTIGSSLRTAAVTTGSVSAVHGISATATKATNLRGSFTVVNDANSATVTFVTPETDASYFLSVTPVSSTNAPVAGSRRVKSIAKSENGFVATVESPPGIESSVTFDWILIR